MRTLRLPSVRGACAMRIVAASVWMLGGCTLTPWPSSSRLVDDDAPVAASEAVATPVPVSAPAVVTQVPAAGAVADLYRVKAGDTLNRIAAAHKQRAADIAAWNKLPASGTVKVGQLLRVAPPASATAQTPATAPANDAPLPAAASVSRATAPAASVASAPVVVASSATRAPATPSAPSSPTPSRSASSAPSASNAPVQPAAAARTATARLAWPVNGSVVTPFAVGKSRSIVIACAPGAPVKAAAVGRVVYAGSGMKGYGKLVIVKHGAHLITAYGRNGRLLVKQGDTVKQGEQIATSSADAAGVGALLFEVRENGKPVDPVAQLPRK